VKVNPEDTAVIQFTGGTTSTPKGVTLSHRNLVANVMQTRSWIPDFKDGKAVVLCALPFSHVYGMTTGMNFAISTGSSMILLPTFDTAEVLEHIRKYRPSLFPGVPAMYVAINNFPGIRKYNIRSIDACLSGAAPLPIEVKEAFEKLTKGKLVEGYGLSEASPVTHANPFYGRNKTGSIGIPVPNTEARILDLRSGKPLPAGQVGELVIRGPQVMIGYWQDEETTKQVLDGDGWLRTNDIARMDEDGYFQIISRRQDMWTGEDERPAFPRDVEEVIYELPEVREVVVVALANRPIAFVSVKDKARLPAKTIIAFCQRRLPPEQVPRLVIFVKDFPRSFIGKVLRRELIVRYQNEITTAEVTAEAGSVGDHLVGLDD
jgi:long-chain acyl-CoA synthetase